jgi:hypothetical protein
MTLIDNRLSPLTQIKAETGIFRQIVFSEDLLHRTY